MKDKLRNIALAVSLAALASCEAKCLDGGKSLREKPSQEMTNRGNWYGAGMSSTDWTSYFNTGFHRAADGEIGLNSPVVKSDNTRIYNNKLKNKLRGQCYVW